MGSFRVKDSLESDLRFTANAKCFANKELDISKRTLIICKPRPDGFAACQHHTCALVRNSSRALVGGGFLMLFGFNCVSRWEVNVPRKRQREPDTPKWEVSVIFLHFFSVYLVKSPKKNLNKGQDLSDFLRCPFCQVAAI